MPGRPRYEMPSSEPDELKNYFLLFKTYYGALLGWCVRTRLDSDDVPAHIESAAQEWLSSDEGKGFVPKEQLEEWGFDYAHAMMNVPAQILASHGIFLWTPISEIMELDADENLLPEELKR